MFAKACLALALTAMTAVAQVVEPTGVTPDAVTSEPTPDPAAQWRHHLDAGKAAHARGDIGGAEREFNAALGIAAHEDPPGLATAVSLNAFAVLYIEKQRWDDAAPLLERAIEIFEAQGLTESEPFATLLCTRGELARGRGSAVDAEKEYRRAVAIKRVSKATHDRAVRGLVGAVCTQGRFEEATFLGAEQRLICRPPPGAKPSS